jgi:hypothetical protein
MPEIVKCEECERETFAGQTRCPHCGELLAQTSSEAGVRSSGGFGNASEGGSDDNLKSILIGFLSGIFAILPISIASNPMYGNGVLFIPLVSIYLIISGIICGLYCRYFLLYILSFNLSFNFVWIYMSYKDSTDAFVGIAILFLIVPMILASNTILYIGRFLGRRFYFRRMNNKNSG